MAAPHGYRDVYSNVRSLSGAVRRQRCRYSDYTRGWIVWGSNHGRDKRYFFVIPGMRCDVHEIFLLSKQLRSTLGHTHLPIQRIPDSFPGVNLPFREVNHTPSPNAEVRK